MPAKLALLPGRFEDCGGMGRLVVSRAWDTARA